MKAEIWNPCGFRKWYEINTDGVVREISTKTIVKQHTDKNGYKYVVLKNGRKRNNTKKFYVHRLMCDAFIVNRNRFEDRRYYQIDHIDRDRGNNNINNLRYVPTEVNQSNKERVPNIIKLDENGTIVNEYNSLEDASRKNDIPQTRLNKIILENNIYKGFFYKKVENKVLNNDLCFSFKK